MAKIQCTNSSCQASNREVENFCTQCSTPIVKRYLWGIGPTVASFTTGEMIGDRYLVKQPRLFLDTQPGKKPETTQDIPRHILPYLLLFPYNLHIPKVYGILDPESEVSSWLLEYNYLPLNRQAILPEAGLFPSLVTMWPSATAIRQLSWLWQMAKLWDPLLKRQVVGTLLNPNLLKTRGAIVQLQELEINMLRPSPPLSQLGELWSTWVDTSQPQIRDFLQQLCTQMCQNHLTTGKSLVTILDQGLYHLGEEQKRSYQIYTLTDSGPTRDHNEDNCYPNSGKLVSDPPHVVVCDGLGGQEGGEIASRLAIRSLEENLNHLEFSRQPWKPKENLRNLDRIVRQVNDQISQRNDHEQRRERQRMGTTLLMAIAEAHELYLTHIGDSRIYLITREGAYQLTVDDDLASREVRLGYALYRDALSYPTSGALVQALGMSPSNNLHPTLQRLVIDEECVVLLCSDGLSDFERVEQHWESQILPILTQQASLPLVGNQLVKIANEKNGHDNVTVGLLYCRVTPESNPTDLDWSVAAASINYTTTIPPVGEDDTEMPTEPILRSPSTPTIPPTEPQTPTPARNLSLPLLLAIVSLIPITLLGYFYREPILSGLGWSNPAVTDPVPPVQPSPTPSPTPEVTSLLPELQVGNIIKLDQDVETTSDPLAETETVSRQIIMSGQCLEVKQVLREIDPVRYYYKFNGYGSEEIESIWIQQIQLTEKYQTLDGDQAASACLQES